MRTGISGMVIPATMSSANLYTHTQAKLDQNPAFAGGSIGFFDPAAASNRICVSLSKVLNPRYATTRLSISGVYFRKSRTVRSGVFKISPLSRLHASPPSPGEMPPERDRPWRVEGNVFPALRLGPSAGSRDPRPPSEH